MNRTPLRWFARPFRRLCEVVVAVIMTALVHDSRRRVVPTRSIEMASIRPFWHILILLNTLLAS